MDLNRRECVSLAGTAVVGAFVAPPQGVRAAAQRPGTAEIDALFDRAAVFDAQPRGRRVVQPSEFDAYNKVYRECFPTDPPARATVGASALNLGAKIELQMIAAR